MCESPSRQAGGRDEDHTAGPVGDPSEIGALVAFLVSDQGGFITGATLDVNGDLLMR